MSQHAPFPTGWRFQYREYSGQWDEPGSPASIAILDAHIRHWAIESITEDEIVFNNDFWLHWPSNTGMVPTKRRLVRTGEVL